jgi:hypothetical protein
MMPLADVLARTENDALGGFADGSNAARAETEKLA